MAINSVFITHRIDAHEGRDAAFTALPRALLHTVMGKKGIMVLQGELCELIININLKLYQKMLFMTNKEIGAVN